MQEVAAGAGARVQERLAAGWLARGAGADGGDGGRGDGANSAGGAGSRSGLAAGLVAERMAKAAALETARFFSVWTGLVASPTTSSGR